MTSVLPDSSLFPKVSDLQVFSAYFVADVVADVMSYYNELSNSWSNTQMYLRRCSLAQLAESVALELHACSTIGSHECGDKQVDSEERRGMQGNQGSHGGRSGQGGQGHGGLSQGGGGGGGGGGQGVEAVEAGKGVEVEGVEVARAVVARGVVVFVFLWDVLKASFFEISHTQ